MITRIKFSEMHPGQVFYLDDNQKTRCVKLHSSSMPHLTHLFHDAQWNVFCMAERNVNEYYAAEVIDLGKIV